MPKARCAPAMYHENLDQYIQSNPDPREIKRAVTVKMWLEGYTHRQIQNILGVNSGFISKWTDQYELWGTEALKLKYKGSKSYLTKNEQEEIKKWLKEKQERVNISMTNERIRQTYYGAVNLLNRECITKKYNGGNSENTKDFIEYLLLKSKAKRIAIIWDGASYHRCEEIRKYLESLNNGLEERQWRVTCIRFAPNCPEQNPMEDIWLQGKRFIREFYHLCKSFKIVKYLFEFSTNNNIFNFAKMFIYGNFSQMI